MHLAISLIAIHSLAVCACAISPGPQTIDCDPASWNSPASVAYETACVLF